MVAIVKECRVDVTNIKINGNMRAGAVENSL